MTRFPLLAFRYRGSLVTAILVTLSLALAACGDPTATSGDSTSPIASTAAPTVTVASPTTAAATSTPVVLATPLPTRTKAPATVPPTATTAPAATAPVATTQANSPLPATAQPGATSGAALATKITEGEVGNFSAQNAYNHVKALAGDIGIRVAGSANQKKAADYIAKQFENSGLKSSFQESVYSWQHDTGSSLTVSGDSSAKPVKLRLYYTDGSPPAAQEAELVFVDGSKIPDLSAVAGKVVLANEADRNLRDILQKLITNATSNNRPLAVLLVPTEPDPLMPPRISQTRVSLAYIEQAAGQQLVKQAAQGTVKVKLSLNWEKSDITIRNVIGTRSAAGNTRTAPVIIIGGHYDSVPEGPGANDNASGTAVTLELARTLAKAYPEVEFRFVGFDGEEMGLIGSAAYVKQLTNDEKSRILAMINIDMISVGNQLSVVGSKTLAGIAKGVALDLGIRDADIQSPTQFGGGSDHASFAQAKIPILSFDRFSDPNYHRIGDTPDKFTPQPLDEVGQITLGTLQRFLLSQN